MNKIYGWMKFMEMDENEWMNECIETVEWIDLGYL